MFLPRNVAWIFDCDFSSSSPRRSAIICLAAFAWVLVDRIGGDILVCTRWPDLVPRRVRVAERAEGNHRRKTSVCTGWTHPLFASPIGLDPIANDTDYVQSSGELTFTPIKRPLGTRLLSCDGKFNRHQRRPSKHRINRRCARWRSWNIFPAMLVSSGKSTGRQADGMRLLFNDKNPGCEQPGLSGFQDYLCESVCIGGSILPLCLRV